MSVCEDRPHSRIGFQPDAPDRAVCGALAWWAFGRGGTHPELTRKPDGGCSKSQAIGAHVYTILYEIMQGHII